jgi:flagellar basal body-associated protein FliL
MKKKDLIALIISVVIMLAAGYLVYTQVMPQKGKTSANAGTQVEVVGVIEPSFDAAALSAFDNASKVRNYSVSLNLGTGLDNQAVFGQ